MKRNIILIISLVILMIYHAIGQENQIFKGTVLDQKTNEPLAYTNIIVLHKYKGTISNESGGFSIDISELQNTDSLSFQYIGYQTKKYILSELENNSTIFLQEDLINLSEAFVYGNPPNPKDIIKKVIENKDANYKRITSKSQVFIRSRDINDIETLKTNIKRNSISELDEGLIEKTIQKIPKHVTSFTDFLGYSYTHYKHKDSLKIQPIKTISLKEIEIAEVDQFSKIFERLFKDTSDDEYWKVKSGIFGQKLDNEEDVKNDTIQDVKSNNDSSSTKSFASNIKYWLNFSLLENTREWEFLYNPGKYKYSLVGGTRVNGEDVYIIDFVPKSGGEYIGKLYISTSTYALIKADYKYDNGKTGTNFHLLGIGYSEDAFQASIYFEKLNGSYQLKYYSKKTGNSYSIERNVSLLKKKKRFLVDKELKEIKVGLVFTGRAEQSIEFLFLHQEVISGSEYAQIKQNKRMKILYIDQFSDDLWNGYPIIEPTKRMREYQKQEVDWNN